jgi:hypothetical protein
VLKDPVELNRSASVDKLPLEPWMRSCPECPTNSGNWSGMENAEVVPAESVMVRVVISRPEESQNRNCASLTRSGATRMPFLKTSQSMATGCCWPLLPVRPNLALSHLYCRQLEEKFDN